MKKFLLILAVALTSILTGCTDTEEGQIGPYPATEILSEEPEVIGYIVDVLEEEQVIFVKSGVTKAEALKLDKQDAGFNMHTFFSNSTTFDGKLEKGFKVAVWKFDEEEGNVHAISEKIVVLEK